MKKYRIITFLLSICATLCFGFACGTAGGGSGSSTDSSSKSSSSTSFVSPVKFVDFEDKTLAVELGDTFSVASYMTVQDEDGNVYHTSAIVETTEGAAVAHMKYEFKIENKSGYKITLAVKQNANVLAKRVLTLTTQDTTSPVVSIGDLPEMGFVGTEYTIPVTINDANPDTQSEIKAFLKDGDTLTEVAVTDGKITPQSAGEYEIKVTANDGINPEAVKFKTFTVRNVLPVNALETFQDPSSVNNLVNTKGTTVWLENFEGREGVAGQTGAYIEYDPKAVWSETNGRWTTKTYYYNFNMMFFRTFAEMAAYPEEAWDYISIWVYIDQANPVKYVTTLDVTAEDRTNSAIQAPNVTVETQELIGEPFTINSKQERFNSIYGKRWQELRLTKDMILGDSFFSEQNADGEYHGTIEKFNMMMNSACEDKAKCSLFYSTQFLPDTVIYIDSVNYVKEVEIPETNGVAGQEVVLSATAGSLECEFEYTVVDPEGNSVMVTDSKFTPMMTGEYSVTATIKHTHACGSKTTSVAVTSDYTIQAAYEYVSPLVGDTIGIPTATVTDATDTVLSHATITASVSYNGTPVVVSNGAFTVAQAGEYEIFYRAVVNGLTLTKAITITALDETQAPNVINGFHTAADAESCGVSNSPTKFNTWQWLNTYEGKQGVIQMVGSATTKQYRNFYFDPSYQYWTVDAFTTYITNADNWDYISIKLWIDMEGDVTVNYIDGTQVVVGQTWQEVKIPRTLLEDNTGRVGTLSALATRLTTSGDYLFFINTGEIKDGTAEDYEATNITVYVDSISLNNYFGGEVSVCATDGGEIKQNSEVAITLTLTDTTTAVYTYSLVDPDGDIVYLGTKEIFTPTKAGEYTLFVNLRNGWSTPIETTFTVAPTGAVSATSKITAASGTEVSIPTAVFTFGNDVVDGVAINYSVSCNSDSVTVTDGKFMANGTIGTVYEIEYTAEYNGTTYS